MLGDVYPQDCRRPGAPVIARHVVERVRPGSIVILHDGVAFGKSDRSQSVDAVAMVVEHLQAKSYRLGTVSHLLEHARRESTQA